MSGPNYHATTHLPKADGGTDPIPGDAIRADRSVKFLIAGPEWDMHRNPPGASLGIGFSFVRDLAIDFGGYYSNGGGEGNEFYIGAPLGPKWSCWGIDVVLAQGPDYGRLKVEVGTQAFGRTSAGYGGEGAGGQRYFDIPNPDNDPITFYSLTGSGDGIYDCYDPSETYNNRTRLGPTMRIAGKFGSLLTAAPAAHPTTPPTTSNDLNGGDGVFYWFRFFCDDQNASSTGFKMRVQAVRIVRQAGFDSYVI